MKINRVFCLFEQSGTWKNEFIKLGIPAEDFDIQNSFGETTHICDLFAEIRGGYDGEPSIFDKITPDDLIIAFFPCTRFEAQILLSFWGKQNQDKGLSDIEKLERDLALHKELSTNYELITKLAIVVLKKNLRMIFENPYTTQHYLTRYWCIEPSVIDNDRTERGDYFKKPTQYWFFNCNPENNFIFEPINLNAIGSMWGKCNTKELGTSDRTTIRSMMHPDYANRFIREFIL